MVEFLKRSVERLQPPTCAACKTEMKWYRSLRPPGQTDLISHYFHCPNCNRIEEIKSKPRTDGEGKKPPPRVARHRAATPLGHPL